MTSGKINARLEPCCNGVGPWLRPCGTRDAECHASIGRKVLRDRSPAYRDEFPSPFGLDLGVWSWSRVKTSVLRFLHLWLLVMEIVMEIVPPPVLSKLSHRQSDWRAWEAQQRPRQTISLEFGMRASLIFVFWAWVFDHSGNGETLGWCS